MVLAQIRKVDWVLVGLRSKISLVNRRKGSSSDPAPPSQRPGKARRNPSAAETYTYWPLSDRVRWSGTLTRI